MGVVTSIGVLIGEDVTVIDGRVACVEVGGEVLGGALAFSGDVLRGLVILVRFKRACTVEAVAVRAASDGRAEEVAAASDF